MRSDDQARAGVLVLRAWVEDGDRLRVRITRTIQGRTTEPASSAAATVEDVCAIVGRWLEELMTGRDGRHLHGR